MYNVFPLVRGALLGTVGAWTFIVLGIAIHFQMSFVDSAPQLTYVSLSVFVAAVTLATFLVILVAPCNRKVSNVLQTKWELAWLGGLALLWTILAGYTTTPAAKDNEVECWEEDEEGAVVDSNVEGYSNSVYHARYRVLQAFAFFNCILLCFLFLFILALAFWHHKRGRYVIWTTPTTSVGWFDGPTRRGHLPPPISHRDSHKDKKRSYEKWDDEKEKGSGHKKAFKFDAASLSERVRDTVKDRMPTSKDKRRAKDTSDIDEFGDRKDLIAKPPPVARANTTPLKPKQYMVSASGETKAKPPLMPPIAVKMTERMEHGGGSKGTGEPKRQLSQREKADLARQQARRERTTSDDERPSRPAVRQNSTRGQRSGSAQPATGVRRETSTTRVPDVRRQPSQTRATPDLTRSGSGADRGRSSAQGQRGRTTDDERYQSRNPYKGPNGRRV